MANANLGAARVAKQDEFYTQWADIEREMNAYLEYDPDVFRDKVVLLPCDDPEWSNFAKFFALHFTEYGIAKLISTSYAPASNAEGMFYTPTLFDDPQFDVEKDFTRGKIFTLMLDDISGDGRVDIEDLQWDYLEGDGDFRSGEVTALRDEADIIITNPPFSLFRTFIAWLMEGDVKFSIIGPKNATTYKEIFPLIKDNKLWIGRGFQNGDAFFRVPGEARTEYADGVYDPETQMVHFRNVGWFTNLEHGRRHEPLQLMTMADNIKFSKHKQVRGIGYRRYANYDGIEIPFTDAIPSDHQNLMGVPITFLDKYNPEQFEILGISKTWDKDSGLKTHIFPTQTQVSKNGVRSQVGKLNDGPAIKVNERPSTTYYEVDGEMFIQAYARILIRHRNPEGPEG